MGAVWHQAGCCCRKCPHCLGETPAEYSLVMSDWSINCVCTEVSYPAGYWTITWGGNINGAHTLDYVTTNQCVWKKLTTVAAGDIVANKYSDAACENLVESIDGLVGRIQWELSRLVDHYKLLVRYLSTSGGEIHFTLFDGTVEDLTDDCTVPSSPITNGQSCEIRITASTPYGEISTNGSCTLAIPQ